MKRIFLALALLLLAVPAFAADKESAYERVIRSNELNCGTYVFNGLFTYNAAQQPEGFIPDLMAEVSKRLNLKIKWTEISSLALAFEDLAQGRYDMICAPFLVDGNLYKKALWGPALTYDPVYAYGDAAKDYSSVSSLAQLNSADYSFVGMDGELGGTYVPVTFPNAKLTMLPQGSNPGQMLMELMTGKVNFVVFGRIAFQAYEQENPGKIKQVKTKPIAVMPLRNGFGYNELQLRALYTAVIEDMQHDGTIDKLLEKHGFGGTIE